MAFAMLPAMWIVSAIVVHVLLLGSIFVIYFRSPVITGLQPQPSLTVHPPARRLVLIVTDGLRAESFFRDGCVDVPHLSDLMLQSGGLVGVSHTRVPTESRPGHIALIAGLYEDPSAVTRGWKNNPVDFDTVFNRSSHTYAWGANDVLHIFSRLGRDDEHRLLFDSYDHELDFSGHDKTYELDEWVFERVRRLLARKGATMRGQRQIIFFLHLLGLDTAGHVHKPGTASFLENLHKTEHGIWETYQLFERTFADARTAYVLTSDHGMTNAGSHGASDPYETETPFFLWGAGITQQAPHTGRVFKVGANVTLPLYAMQQAQFAPLMSALIGVAPPMNNFGVLPLQFLNVSTEYGAHAAHSNALQLLAQYQALLAAHQRGFFASYLRQFDQLNESSIAAYLKTTKRQLKKREFEAVIEASYKVMYSALAGIDYYHGYYRVPLLLSTAITFLCWIAYCLQLMIQPNRSHEKIRASCLPSPTLFALAVLCITFLALQRVPLVIGFYLALPIGVWAVLVRGRCVSPLALSQALPLRPIVWLILCAELLVFSFFERRLISLAFVIFAVASNFRTLLSKSAKFYIWLFLVITLAVFPLLPPSVGYANTPLLLFGMATSMLRPFLTKSRLSFSAKLISSVCLANGVFILYWHSQQQRIPVLSQIVSWTFLVYVFVSIARDKATALKQRVEFILFQLSTLYALLSTSYEPLFVLMLASELVLALSVQPLQIPLQQTPSSQFTATTTNSPQQLINCFRLAFAILLYTLFSFFGTGNIASVSSFDPNIIRCFLSTFSPFVIMALVILKLVVPVLLNISIIFGMSACARAHEQQVFICLLLICDVMGMNFLFLVRNEGSWLEIGTSISHFVIMEVTTLILLVLTYVAKLFLRLNTLQLTTLKLK